MSQPSIPSRPFLFALHSTAPDPLCFTTTYRSPRTAMISQACPTTATSKLPKLKATYHSVSSRPNFIARIELTADLMSGIQPRCVGLVNALASQSYRRRPRHPERSHNERLPGPSRTPRLSVRELNPTRGRRYRPPAGEKKNRQPTKQRGNSLSPSIPSPGLPTLETPSALTKQPSPPHTGFSCQMVALLIRNASFNDVFAAERHANRRISVNAWTKGEPRVRRLP